MVLSEWAGDARPGIPAGGPATGMRKPRGTSWGTVGGRTWTWVVRYRIQFATRNPDDDASPRPPLEPHLAFSKRGLRLDAGLTDSVPGAPGVALVTDAKREPCTSPTAV